MLRRQLDKYSENNKCNATIKNKSKCVHLIELVSVLLEQCSEGKIILDEYLITSPTFKWCLKTIGLNSLTIYISEPSNSIKMTQSNDLVISGSVILYEGWDAAPFTFTLSSGNTESTILYAICSMRCLFSSFYLPQVFNSGLIPLNSIDERELPCYTFIDVPLLIYSTSATTLPNCQLQFGVDKCILPFPWTIVNALQLVTPQLGFTILNIMNKGEVVIHSFLLHGIVLFGEKPVDVTLTLPVDYFSVKVSWFLQLQRRDKQLPYSEVHTNAPHIPLEGEDIVSLCDISNKVGIQNLTEHYPSPLLQIGDFRVKYYTVRFNLLESVVYLIDMTLDIPSNTPWEVVPNELTIHNISLIICAHNPFSTVNGRHTFHVLGQCGVTLNKYNPVLTVGGARSETSATEWYFDISGEIGEGGDEQEYHSRVWVTFAENAAHIVEQIQNMQPQLKS